MCLRRSLLKIKYIFKKTCIIINVLSRCQHRPLWVLCNHQKDLRGEPGNLGVCPPTASYPETLGTSLIKRWGLATSSHTGADSPARRTYRSGYTSSSPPLLTSTPLSSVVRAQLQADLDMQLLSCHTVHKEGEHLAPHRVFAPGTGLGTEEGKIIKGPGGTEQDPGALCAHWRPSPCLPRNQAHTCHGLWEARGQNNQTQRRGELCQEVLQWQKIILALALPCGWGGVCSGDSCWTEEVVSWWKGHRLRAKPVNPSSAAF